MPQGRFRGDAAHLLQFQVAERSAGGGEDDLVDSLGVAIRHRLHDRVMLGIDGQQGGTRIRHRAQHHLPGRNQGFLIGEGDGAAIADRRQRGFQPDHAGDGGHRPVGRNAGSLDHRRTAGGTFKAGAGQRGAQFR
jgi:hypothetical protein